MMRFVSLLIFLIVMSSSAISLTSSSSSSPSVQHSSESRKRCHDEIDDEIDDEKEDDEEPTGTKKQNGKSKEVRVIVSTLTGLGASGMRNGGLDQSQFYYPRDVVHDMKNQVSYVADDRNKVIRLINHITSHVSTFCNMKQNTPIGGYNDGTIYCLFLVPEKYRSFFGHLLCGLSTSICSISSDGKSKRVLAGSSIEGYLDGIGDHVLFSTLNGMAMDSLGRLIISDTFNHCIRRLCIDEKSLESTIAGSPGQGRENHINPLLASFSYVRGVYVDTHDNIYIVDSDHGIRRMDNQTGAITTFVHDSIDGFTSILFAHEVNHFFAIYSNSVQMISPAGKISHLAGTVSEDDMVPADGDGTIARFHNPHGIALEYVQHSTNWIHSLFSINPFKIWPPGLLLVVLDYLPQTVSLLICDPRNNSIRRIIVELPRA